MSKYDALGRFLASKTSNYVPMTFQELEAITGAQLPNSKQYPAWWSNNPGNNVMTKIWLEAGYRTEQVDTAGEKLVFRRAVPIPELQESNRMFVPASKREGAAMHPIVGAMKGTFIIEPGIIEPGWTPSKPIFDRSDLEEINAGIDKTAALIEQGMRGVTQ